MLSRDSVLNALKTKGPCLPVHIKQFIGSGDTFMIGALLTELREAGKIKVSNTKRGGSPFYYIPEHAGKLVNLLPDLGEKDRRAAQLLQEKKILKDIDQDPLIRVCLRQIKDFAIPIEVKLKEGTQLFWKWYSLPNTEAEHKVKEMLGILPKPTAPETPKPRPPTPVRKQNTQAAEPVKETSPINEGAKEPTPVPANKLLKEKDDTGDAFLKQILEYFAEKHIQIITKDIKRKNTDIEFELSMPTAVGRVEYFCKAKSKKKNNDGDLSSAYLQGQGKRLPVLYITTGEVTKKAKEKLKHEFKGLVLIEL